MNVGVRQGHFVAHAVAHVNTTTITTTSLVVVDVTVSQMCFAIGSDATTLSKNKIEVQVVLGGCRKGQRPQRQAVATSKWCERITGVQRTLPAVFA